MNGETQINILLTAGGSWNSTIATREAQGYNINWYNCFWNTSTGTYRIYNKSTLGGDMLYNKWEKSTLQNLNIPLIDGWVTLHASGDNQVNCSIQLSKNEQKQTIEKNIMDYTLSIYNILTIIIIFFFPFWVSYLFTKWIYERKNKKNKKIDKQKEV